MSTDPSVPRQTVTPPPRPVTRTVTVSSPGAIVGAVLTIALGIALGLANQGASGTDMALRVPALLAALLMVGSGVQNLTKNLPKQQEVELVPEQDSGPRGRELAVVRPMQTSRPVVTTVSVKPSPSTLSVPIVVMVLAAWLGLADLRVSAPPTLSVLSLVAAFALFALGWSLLPAKK